MAIGINWQTEEVELAGFSTWPSLAFSPSGQPAIAYHSSDNKALRFAEKQVDGSWAISTVDAVAGDCSPSLAFRFAQPAISYSGSFAGGGSGKEIRYAIRRGHPGWTIEIVTPRAHRTSVAIDPSHRPGISYDVPGTGPGTGLLFARSDTPSTWAGEVADPDEDAGGDSALAFTPSGQPRIAYVSHDLIKFAVFIEPQWKLEAVGPGDGWISLAFTPAGEPAICYSRFVYRVQGRRPAVIFAIRRGGTWNREWIVDGDSPYVAFSPAVEPAISYVEDQSQSVMFALFFDRTWHHFTVEQPNPTPTGGFVGPFTLTSLAFNPLSGQPAISYYDRGNATIRYAIGTVFQQGMLTALFSSIRDLLKGHRRANSMRRRLSGQLP
jgi:hypothetical protein